MQQTVAELNRELPEPAQGSHTAAPATDQPCDEPAGATAVEAGAAATVPLVEGITLASTWWGAAGSDDDYEHECLTQVVSVTAREIVLSSSCPAGRDRAITRGRRRVCRADLEAGSIYITRRGPASPEMVAGSTADLLSRNTLRALRSSGAAEHREMSIETRNAFNGLIDLARSLAQGGGLDADALAGAGDAVVVEYDLRGELRNARSDTMHLPVNGRVVALPILRTSGVLEPLGGTGPRMHRHLAVLDDENAPWVLDLLSDSTGRRIRIDRITYPERESLERDLANDRQTTLHGVYFEYGSDALREESAAVLAEIAEILRRNPSWALAVHGHTDNQGGDAFNLELSNRRAAAVRDALVEHYGIDGSRLRTAGFGAAQPRDTNETTEGRARNRRVELVRQ